MAEKNNNLDLFDAYLTSQLAGKDLRSFEEKIRTDAAFAKAFEEHKDFVKGINYANEKKIREMLTSVKNELTEEQFFEEERGAQVNEVKIISFRRIMSIAAAVLLLLGMTFFYSNFENKDLQKNLFAEFYQPEKIILQDVLDRLEAQGFSSESKAEDAQFAAVLTLYETGKFDMARKNLSTFLKSHPNNQIAQFYFGLSLIETNEFSEAAAVLAPLSEDTNFKFTDAAAWYQALVYSKFNSPEGKENMLLMMEKIATSQQSDFSEKARAFLKLAQ